MRFPRINTFTSVNTVGPTKFPFSKPWTTSPLPSRASVAPSFTPDSTRSHILFLDRGDITGPRSVPGICPAFTFNFFDARTNSGIHSFDLPTNMATESAMHLWPAAPNAAPTIWEMLLFLFASGRTMQWFFAPMLHCTRFPWALLCL